MAKYPDDHAVDLQLFDEKLAERLEVVPLDAPADVYPVGSRWKKAIFY